MTRWALVIAFGSLATLLALSTILNAGESLLLGPNSTAALTEDSSESPARGEVEGSLPSTKRLNPQNAPPTAALVVDLDLTQPSDELLTLLDESDIKATFFVGGEDIPAHQSHLQEIADAGHEIGLSSFSRSRLGELSEGQQLRRYRLTQQYVEAVTGLKPRLLRLPFSVKAAELPESELRAAQNLADAGFVPVFADVVLAGDDDDATLDGDSLLDGQKAVVLLGELASQPAEQPQIVLRELIQQANFEGYEFLTVSEFGGISSAEHVSTMERLQSRSLLRSTSFQRNIGVLLALLAVGVGALLVVRYGLALLILLARGRLRPTAHADAEMTWPGVSLLIPADETSANLERTLTSIRKLAYKGPIEVTVIDDGSGDKAAICVREFLDINELNVRVLSQREAGRVPALNEGIRNASHGLCVLTSASAVFERHSIRHAVAPFSDSAVGAVTGTPIVETKSWLSRFAMINKLSRFHVEDRMETRLGLATEVSGAICVVRRSAVVDVGGLASVTTAEDTDLAVSLRLRGWRVYYEPRAAVTLIGESAAGFWQSLRLLWSRELDRRYGMLQVIWKHRGSRPGARNRRYRVLALSYRLVTDFFVPLAVPLVDAFLLISLLGGRGYRLAALWFLSIALQIFASWVSVLLSRSRDVNILFSLPQFVFFRYLDFLVALRAVFLVVDGRKMAVVDANESTPPAKAVI